LYVKCDFAALVDCSAIHVFTVKFDYTAKFD
jgi:hypothetical protein